MSDETAWWTANLSPWSGCKDLALPPDQRAAGCKKRWLSGMLTGPRGKVIHGAAKPWEIVLHPNRLRQALTTKEPQRYGYINGEVADVATDHPEYLAACVGVALARPDHGFGVPTSDPGAVVEWARRLNTESAWSVCIDALERVTGRKVNASTALFGEHEFPPRNWIWLLSISTQQEADERLPYGVELGRMGWRWAAHCEPMYEPLSIVPDAYGVSLADMPCWICSGPPKGHKPTESELDWHRALMQQTWAAGIPYWYKGKTMPGEALHNRALPGGWPA